MTIPDDPVKWSPTVVDGNGTKVMETESVHEPAEAASDVRLSRDTGAAMKGVILDTNVFVAAGFRPQSASGRVVEAVRNGRYRLIWTEATRREAEAVLGRIPRLHWTDVSDLFADAGAFTRAVAPDAFAYNTDPNDRKFAALGAATGCPAVSSDGDLLAHKEVFSFDVLTPQSFLQREGLDPGGGRKAPRA
ncbi:PIN domain-containing protein [Azospirillum canadense]|uniref:PIN domain-containing protein n=1 Tax=Azospirillum canadense TaxID=403962 RepID=UPI0022267570|nr:PIN domain-containing protein [Azospirillum canadense]MCW2239595.1 putative nucleic acid-binding protein [Azospirillum canadense]